MVCGSGEGEVVMRLDGVQHGQSARLSARSATVQLNRLDKQQRLRLIGKTVVQIAISLSPYAIVACVLLFVILFHDDKGDFKIYLLSAMADACNSFEASVTCILIAIRYDKSRYLSQDINAYWKLMYGSVTFAKGSCAPLAAIGILLLMLALCGYAESNLLLLWSSAAVGLFCRIFAVALEARVDMLATLRDESLQ